MKIAFSRSGLIPHTYVLQAVTNAVFKDQPVSPPAHAFLLFYRDGLFSTLHLVNAYVVGFFLLTLNRGTTTEKYQLAKIRSHKFRIIKLLGLEVLKKIHQVRSISVFAVWSRRKCSSTSIPKDIVLTPISFRCSQLVEPGKDFATIWIQGPVGLSSGLSP